jgi:hypothetical protein
VPPEHVVALYESVRARASAKEILRLNVEGDEEKETADVEIQVSDGSTLRPDRRILVRTSQAGSLKFGRQVNGVFVDAPQLDAVIGSGAPVELVAPVSMNVSRLTFDCPELAVVRGDATLGNEESAAVLEANQLVESRIVGAPTVRKGVEFSVSWPGANVYPWVQFAFVAGPPMPANLHDALLRLRKLVMAFRSHSRGRLARFKDKIEHSRMTKGQIGVAIRNKLLKDGILAIEGEMYYLSPNALGATVGATYQDLNFKRFNDRVREYVAAIIA